MLFRNQLTGCTGTLLINFNGTGKGPMYPWDAMKGIVLEGKHILVLWCPAGDNRPYTAPMSLGERAQRQNYIRVNSQTIIAKGDNVRRPQELAARIPFDDRVNNKATIDDFDLGIIRAYLQEIKSDLFKFSSSIPFEELCRTMLIAKGPNEDLRPVNVGLSFPKIA